ncbi:MAG: hypothetical protein IJQ82_08320 [Selenomonadaceae bacterium]|nr:hypothetical protein [Selenomonadaceae bacterium]
MRKEDIAEIAKTAAIEALGLREDIIREEFDKRYRDVKLLMRNYRKLKAYYSRVDAEALEVSVICSMHHKTGLMMSHVDKMLIAYKALCQESDMPDEFRRWEVLYLRYMADKRMKIDDIADSLNVNKRTLYRDTERAMEDMAVLLFGIEAIGTWKHRNSI